MEEVAQKQAGQDDLAISWKTIFICLYPCFGGILFGYDSGYINGALNIDQFKHDYGTPGHAVEVAAPGGYLYSDAQKSLIVSILSAGTFIGALTAGYFADRLGRRLTIQIGCIIYTIGVILQMAVASVAFLAAGRGVAGVGVGFVSATVIMYVSEIAPKKIRGTLVSCYQFSITIGLLLAAAVAYATKDLMNSGAYRILIGLQFLWALTLGSGLLLLPESPRWYVMKARKEKAEKSLAKIRSLDVNDPFVKQEYADLVDSHRKDVGDGEGGWIECFQGGLKGGSNLRRTLLGMTIQMMQQLSKLDTSPRNGYWLTYLKLV
jgi:SP family sugar:H+ symporter-like MFS transporter